MVPHDITQIYDRNMFIYSFDYLFTYVLVYSFITSFTQQVELRA